MTTQACLADGLIVRALLWRLRGFLRNDDIRVDPLGLNRASRRRVVTSGGEHKRAFVVERNYGLNRTFAERSGANDDCAMIVLQRASHDFRCRSRTAVD